MSSTEEESDDDDLPAILQRSPTKKQTTVKSADEILTPRRSIKPEHDELLSPMNESPLSATTADFTATRRRGNAKQVSMSDLMKEKKLDDEIKRKVEDIMKMKGIMLCV